MNIEDISRRYENVSISAETPVFTGVSVKTTSYKARYGHIDAPVDMLYQKKWGKKKFVYTSKYLKNDVTGIGKSRLRLKKSRHRSVLPPGTNRQSISSGSSSRQAGQHEVAATASRNSCQKNGVWALQQRGTHLYHLMPRKSPVSAGKDTTNS
mgnify:CR=1 FL=1